MPGVQVVDSTSVAPVVPVFADLLITEVEEKLKSVEDFIPRDIVHPCQGIMAGFHSFRL